MGAGGYSAARGGERRTQHEQQAAQEQERAGVAARVRKRGPLVRLGRCRPVSLEPVLPAARSVPPPDRCRPVCAACTTIVAFMNGCGWQKYEKVPAWAKVCEADWPAFRIPVLNEPLFAVAECGVGPVVHPRDRVALV
jgi:hypothetical protein